MRTIDSSISVLKPSNIAWWHTSWTGRFILAALLIAAVAFVLTPGRTSAQTTADPGRSLQGKMTLLDGWRTHRLQGIVTYDGLIARLRRTAHCQ